MHLLLCKATCRELNSYFFCVSWGSTPDISIGLHHINISQQVEHVHKVYVTNKNLESLNLFSSCKCASGDPSVF